MNGEHTSQKGIALVLVLWVLTLLSVIAGQFCHAMRTEVNITRNFKESTQAYYVARAGMSRTLTELIRNQIFPDENEFEAIEGEEPKQRLRINVENPEEEFKGGKFSVWIENESGKINLNGADRNVLMMMLNGLELDEDEKETIVDSILDWRDSDDLHRLNGAESDYYQSLENPYECKNADFDSIEELLLVKGVTSEIFYGGLESIVTVQGVVSGATPPGAGSRPKPRAPGVRMSAGSKININAAPHHVLLVLPLMTEEIAAEIQKFRAEKDFKSLTEVQEVVGPEVFGAISPYIDLTYSSFYVIRAKGRTDGSPARRTVRARVEIDGRYQNRYRILQWIDA
jgi:general secretion pathway protein K